jgi:hypothetical protein
MKTTFFRPSIAVVVVSFAALFTAMGSFAQGGAPVVPPKINPLANQFNAPSIRSTIKLEVEYESPLTCAKIGGAGASITIKLTNVGTLPLAPGDARIDVTLVAGGQTRSMPLGHSAAVPPGGVFHGIIGGQPTNRFILSAQTVSTYVRGIGASSPRFQHYVPGTLTFSLAPGSKVKQLGPASPMQVKVPIVSDAKACGLFG